MPAYNSVPLPPISEPGKHNHVKMHSDEAVQVLLENIIQMQRRQLAENEQRLHQLLEWKERNFPWGNAGRGNDQQESDHHVPNNAENLSVLNNPANQPVSNLETKAPQQPNEEPDYNTPKNAENLSGLNKPVNQAITNLEIKAPQHPTEDHVYNPVPNDAHHRNKMNKAEHHSLSNVDEGNSNQQFLPEIDNASADGSRATIRQHREFDFILHRRPQQKWLRSLGTLGTKMGLRKEDSDFVGIDEMKRQSLRHSNPSVSKLSRFIHSKRFTCCIVVLIIANAVLIAYEEDMAARTAFDYHKGMRGASIRELPASKFIGWFFTLIFLLELIVRIFCERWYFIVGRDWIWNTIDTVVVVSALIESFYYTFAGFNLSFVRVVRILRALRGLKFLRILRFFKEVRVMLVSIINCLWPLLWFLSFLTGIIFMFGLIFLQAASEYLWRAEKQGRHLDVSDSTYVGLQTHFSSFLQTMLTLFVVITGGEDWYRIQQIINTSSAVYGVLFVLYIATMILGILNIITGIFVETTFSLAQMDRTIVTQNEMEKNVRLMEGLRELFEEFDEDESGSISWKEFEKNVCSPEVGAYLRALDLEATQVEGLFKLLDTDAEGTVDIDEFVMGCLRLKGSAKTVDVATIMYDQKIMESKLLRVLHYIQSHCSSIESCVNQMKAKHAMSSSFGANSQGVIASL